MNGIDVSGLWAFASIYRLFSSGVNSLLPTPLSSLTTDMTKIGVRMGIVYTIISFGTLSGTPIASALNSADDGRSLGMEMCSCLAIDDRGDHAGCGKNMKIRVEAKGENVEGL
ncbi:hypothetical protein SLS53_006238 [Cytospora paraplurivora]|uniref:Uncharacterized protein n=1 Tax=Cytospora paraplurivora TaxID=2898453 RepID=A0AAN9YF78_9PEZI